MLVKLVYPWIIGGCGQKVRASIGDEEGRSLSSIKLFNAVFRTQQSSTLLFEVYWLPVLMYTLLIVSRPADPVTLVNFLNGDGTPRNLWNDLSVSSSLQCCDLPVSYRHVSTWVFPIHVNLTFLICLKIKNTLNVFTAQCRTRYVGVLSLNCDSSCCSYQVDYPSWLKIAELVVD